METFIENTRERIHTRIAIRHNGSCQIWTSSLKKGSNYGLITYKDTIDGKHI